MTRLKLAELTSGIGALVLGVGLGALFPHWFATSAGFIVLAGVVAHGFGMWDKHRLEAQAQAESGPWVVALYWVCWLLLAAVVALLLVRR
jgi:hypothetical protein